MAFFVISMSGCCFFPIVEKAEEPTIKEELKVTEEVEPVIEKKAEEVITQPMK